MNPNRIANLITEDPDEINRDLLNKYLKQQRDWREKRKSGQTRDSFQYSQDQLDQIGNVIKAAKKKIEQIINTHYRREWPMYREWEKKAQSIGFLFGHFTPDLEELNHSIKVGDEFDFSKREEVTVPQEFYYLLMWREIIKVTASAYENSGNPNNTTILAKGIRRLAALLKSNS